MKHSESNEEKLIASGRGKWSEIGVPHKGWICIDIEDLGEPQITCDMCESQLIRYVHYMEHPKYPNLLEVGCVCAGHMEGDLVTARLRESSMKSRAGKRKRWLTRKWKTSMKGNPWIRADNYRVTVFKKGKGWGASVTKEVDDSTIFSKRVFQSEDKAKLAAFDQITRLESIEI